MTAPNGPANLKSSLFIACVTAASFAATGCGSDDNPAAAGGSGGFSGMTTGGTSSTAGGSSAASKSIVEIATTNPDFSVLAAAIKAGLVEALGGDNLTVFAPSNAASVVLNQGVNIGFLGMNDSKVITTDLYTSNGVVHVIDKVIAPAKM